MKIGRTRQFFNATAVIVALSFAASVAPQFTSARTPGEPETTRSLIGSYLAGRFARTDNDTRRAAQFYRAALLRDPGNVVLLEQAFLMEATAGNWDRAELLADELVGKQPMHRMARMFLGLNAFKAKNYDMADDHLKAAANGPIGELTSLIARGWVKLANGDEREALKLLRSRKQAEWAQFYLKYHFALASDLAGMTRLSRPAFEDVFEQDSRTLRTALAYAQHAAHARNRKLASRIIRDHLDAADGDPHPLAVDLQDRVEAREPIELLVRTPSEGMAELYYGLGEALTGEGGVSIGMLYLQMALYLEPKQPFALAALANALESTDQHAEANAVYDRIPGATPLQSAIEIRKAFNLNAMDQVDKAKRVLERLADKDTTDIRPLDALGSIMRSHKRYGEAIEYYTRAIALIDKPKRRHWSYYYARGTCYERIKQWSKAEADLKMALKLYPDQPLALNYLGYSWIDQNINLKKGMKLIEKAVELKPDDGYIVDSLGWAHYRLGNYQEATRYLERAVELRPEDPVLNDHLGDALWRVGREREARFQWDQALSLGPEADEIAKIQAKLKNGLPIKKQAKLPDR